MKESDHPALEELCTRLKRNSLECIYGRGVSGKLLWGEIPRDSQPLLLGRTGLGKTCLAAAILQLLWVANSAAHLQLVFRDRNRQIALLNALAVGRY